MKSGIRTVAKWLDIIVPGIGILIGAGAGLFVLYLLQRFVL